MVTVMVEDGNLEKAIKKFRKEVDKEGILEEYKKRQYFVKPSAIVHQKKVTQEHYQELAKKENK